MKKSYAIVLIFGLLLFTFSLSPTCAQAPQKMSYQAVVRNASNELVTSHSVGMRTSILQGSETGTEVYREIYNPNPQTNANGLVTIEIGSGIPTVGTFTTIDWATGPYFIKTEIDPTGGTSYTITSISQLLSVPYAFYATKAANVFSGNYNDLTNKPNLEVVATTGNYNDLLAKPSLFSGNYNDLLDKPGIATTTTVGFMSAIDKTRLDGIAAGAEVNVNADWIATTGDAVILNKPDLNVYYTKTNLQTSGQAQIDAGNIATGTLGVVRGGSGSTSLTGVLIGNGASAFTGVTHTGASQYLRRNSANTAYEFGTLSTVAGSGNYNDLINRPTIVNTTNYATATGYQALNSNSSTGIYNTAMGHQALYSNSTGDYNTAYGVSALYSNVANTHSTAIGYQAMYYAYNGTSGMDAHNTAVGFQALLGSSSPASNTGRYNTAVGGNALYSNTSGNDNTSIGVFTLYYNTTGTYNTATGYDALYRNTEGGWNTAFGGESLLYNTTGSCNTGSGGGALATNTTGSNNTAFGFRALAGGSVASKGDNNTAVGMDAAYGSYTGSNNTMLGYAANPSSTTVSNQITLGNNQITSLRCNVQSISSLSDGRDKRNIKDLSQGLNFIMQLKPRQFQWDKREWYKGSNSDGTRMQSSISAGFIAQELDEVQTRTSSEWLNLVLKDNPDRLEATYGNLLPVMVKAIQEQQQQIESYKSQLQLLKEKVEKMESIIGKGEGIDR